MSLRQKGSEGEQEAYREVVEGMSHVMRGGHRVFNEGTNIQPLLPPRNCEDHRAPRGSTIQSPHASKKALSEASKEAVSEKKHGTGE